MKRTLSMVIFSAMALVGSVETVWAESSSYVELYKQSTPVFDLTRTLIPFVATCDREKTHFRKLFCTALNERLKAQQQSKMYRYRVGASEVGPLVATFNAGDSNSGNKPSMTIKVRGCLTCNEPVLERKGGDISKARFFVFKLPQDIAIQRGKGSQYDLGDITMASYQVPLPEEMDEKQFKEEVLPHLLLELLYRPVAGVTDVGGRYKYGVLTFELVGHRIFHKCEGSIYGSSPDAGKRVPVSKTDLSCPQNRPKDLAKKPELPSEIPQEVLSKLLASISGDLHTCYNQFGLTAKTPTEIVVSKNGKVAEVKVKGEHEGSMTAHCVERLIRDTKFPSFSGDKVRLQWPFEVGPR